MAPSIDMPPRRQDFSRILMKSQLCVDPPKLPSVDLSGQTAIITGGTSGLGLEAGRQYLQRNLARLIIACRSANKGEAAAAKLRLEFPKATIDVWNLEMTSYDSIQAFAAKAYKELDQLNIVVLNAGIMQKGFKIVLSTGHEQVVQVNYLSTLLLAILLLPALKRKVGPGHPGRLSIVNSGTALGATFSQCQERPLLPAFDSVRKFKWDPSARYIDSKLLGHLGMAKLKDSVSPDDVVVNLVDPGLTKGTGLYREANGFADAIFLGMTSMIGRSVPTAASTYLDATVVKGKESHGCFIFDWAIHP